MALPSCVCLVYRSNVFFEKHSFPFLSLQVAHSDVHSAVSD